MSAHCIYYFQVSEPIRVRCRAIIHVGIFVVNGHLVDWCGRTESARTEGMTSAISEEVSM